MANKRKPCFYACDFETTVEENTRTQYESYVWSAAYAELYSDNQNIFHSIEDFFTWFFSCPDKSVFYFHNLKFDGFFILWYLLKQNFTFFHGKTKDMQNDTFDAVISGDRRFYLITIKKHGFTFFIRDSLKLLPFRLEQIGKAFNTKHQKLKMEYKGNHYPGCKITPEESAYIINDVLCLKEALEIMIDRGMKKLTIGANCISFFREHTRKQFDFKKFFRDLKAFELVPGQYGYDNADQYIRKSYRGGWCYLKPEYANLWLRSKGKTFDVNSLYPSVMHSLSGNYYPIGEPVFFKKRIPDEAFEEDKIFFVRVRFIGQLKKGYLPTIQVKDNLLYRPTEWITTTDIYHEGKYHKYYYDTEGVLRRVSLTLTLTKPDYELLLSHYDIEKITILDGCYFAGAIGLFDTYINHWFRVKMESKDKVSRTVAKLMLNNLYGKFATNDDSSYMLPDLTDEEVVSLELVEEHKKDTINIAVGSMVTAYARYFTITHAQANYDRFIYADTDSLHCLDTGEVYNDIVEDDKALLTWKNETTWSSAKFIRQKTYCEYVRYEDSEKVKPYWLIKCAGMTDACKRRMLSTHPITDFDYGLTVSGKLRPKTVKGGVVLIEDEFTLKEYKEKSLKKWLQNYS